MHQDFVPPGIAVLTGGRNPEVISKFTHRRANVGETIQLIDHVYISVLNIDKSLAFYSEALKPLGWKVFGNYDSASGPKGVPDLYGIGDDSYGSGKAVGSSIWLRRRKLGETGLYLGIVCNTNELSMPPTPPQSRRAELTRANRQIAPTSLPATMPPTSLTSTVIVLSSCIKPGTPSNARKAK